MKRRAKFNEAKAIVRRCMSEMQIYLERLNLDKRSREYIEVASLKAQDALSDLHAQLEYLAVKESERAK